MKYKIAFFDIDGTLIDMNTHKITDRTLQALHGLQQKGVRICLATGRAPSELPHFPGLAFDAYLTFNGSYCFNEKETIFSNPLSRQDVQALIANGRALGHAVAVATAKRLAADSWDEDMAKYYEFGGLTLKPDPDFEKIAGKETVYQVLMSCREAEYPWVLQGVQGAKIAAWWDRAADIIPADGGKGLAIEKMLEYYGLDKSEALAFGDGNNDIEMLQAAGCGVAMANASDRLKAVADEVCGHVAEDGVYCYCTEHGLI